MTKKDSKEREQGKEEEGALEEKVSLADEYLDQLQRVQADFENYRKRVLKEKEEFRKYVLEGFLYNLIGIMDNIQRAVEASEKNNKLDTLIEGVHMVQKQFLDSLKTQGVVSMETRPGDKFNPHLHYAVSHEPSPDYPVDTIVKVMQPGYEIGDRVLRPAMVVVSKSIVDEEGEQEEKQD